MLTPSMTRKANPMILNIAIILAAQLVGEVLARLLTLPIPGPVIGMALLLYYWRVSWPANHWPTASCPPRKASLRIYRFCSCPPALG
jgi:uncharacterized membrane protein